MEQIRKLAAIMFTDIQGYTRLMQESESSAVQMRSRHREIFDPLTGRFGGQVIQYYGDGTLSIFDSTVNAVRCALEMQKKFLSETMIPVRIGIHTGDILISENDIIGDSVNLASRIESLGVPGSVLVSEKVVEEIKNQDDLPVKLMGAFHFKNDEKPRRIFALANPEIVIPRKKQLTGKLKQPSQKIFGLPVKHVKYISVILFVVLSLTLLFGSVMRKQAKIKWATYEALPQIEELVQSSWRDYTEAYNLAIEAEKILPENERLRELISLASFPIDIKTEPEGARVYYKEYEYLDKEWVYLGETPLSGVQLPKGFLRWKVEKKGYHPVFAVEPTFDLGDFTNLGKNNFLVPHHFFRSLEEEGKVPAGMTRVTGGETFAGKIKDFFIDRFEVTNREYKDFVDRGGYENQKYWKHEFTSENQTFSWQEAMSQFVDKTGQPGPSTWEAGDYPDGESDFPVGGVSWYEAAAYSEFRGKALPTNFHWGLACGENTFMMRWPQLGGYALFAPYSNFNNEGPVPVGKYQGMTAYGAMDMAGNMWEWCFNETDIGRSLRGGSWNNNIYSFQSPIQAPAFDRSPTNGIRCAIYIEPDSVPQTAYEKVTLPRHSGINYDLKPVSDEIFEIYKEQYSYDKKELQAKTISIDTSYSDWIEETVIYNAPYGEEKIIGHLFLPNNAVPPYQVVVYVPGSGSLWQMESENMAEYYEFPVFLDFIVKTGRAVLYPVYKGTFERRLESFALIHYGSESHEYAEVLKKVVIDFRTSVDYLESRKDIDANKIAYYGMSWGGAMGPIFSAIENRIATSIYVSGGLSAKVRPEVLPVNFLPRVKSPTLMVNGRYDSLFPLETHILPMFELLGTPDELKKLTLFESDHIPPRNEMIREILNWLDKYVGPVKKLET